MPETLVLHVISDLHFGALKYTPENKIPLLDKTFDKKHNAQHYLDYLQQQKSIELPDIVLIPGDLTSYASEDEFYAAEDFIKQLSKRLKDKPSTIEKHRIVIVPGNHDLDWSHDNHEEKIRRYSRFAELVCAEDDVMATHARKHADRFWDYGDDANLFIYLFNSVKLGGEQDPEIKRIYEGLANPLFDGAHRSNVVQELKKIGRMDAGYIEEEEITNFCKAAKRVPKERIKIALLHHNISSVPSNDAEKFDTILNAGVFKAHLMNQGVDFVVHGHRHLLHLSRENALIEKKNLFVVSAGSLGSNPDAPFLEIRINNPTSAHSVNIPLASIEVLDHRRGTTGYSQEHIYSDSISEPIRDAMSRMLHVRNTDGQMKDKEFLSALSSIQTLAQDLYTRSTSWEESSARWADDFHQDLDQYSNIYATAIMKRSPFGAPVFERYLRDQYSQRWNSLRRRRSAALYFSKPVYNAIRRTDWRPDKSFGDNIEIKCATEAQNPKNFEIVRIVVGSNLKTHEREQLKSVDQYHRLFAIPLFYIDVADLNPSEVIDFAIGFKYRNTKDENDNKDIVRCYVYDNSSRKVVQTPIATGANYTELFEQILANPLLTTINEDVVTTRIEEVDKFADAYDTGRKASKLILDRLRSNLKQGPNCAGLDLGCGTGNYTLPFVDSFGSLHGLDRSQGMLRKAREKVQAEKVSWIFGDATRLKMFRKEQIDSVWMISALHYLNEERQKLMLQEVLRVLKPGGVFFADTEFLEQHASLWITHFFPSLQSRYKDKLFTTDFYRKLLTDIGFSRVELSCENYYPQEGDGFLRIGQYDPERYLKQAVRSVIPAFNNMEKDELRNGLGKLKRAIKTRLRSELKNPGEKDRDEVFEIDRIMRQYREKATLDGDLGFIVAIK